MQINMIEFERKLQNYLKISTNNIITIEEIFGLCTRVLGLMEAVTRIIKTIIKHQLNISCNPRKHQHFYKSSLTAIGNADPWSPEAEII